MRQEREELTLDDKIAIYKVQGPEFTLVGYPVVIMNGEVLERL